MRQTYASGPRHSPCHAYVEQRAEGLFARRQLSPLEAHADPSDTYCDRVHLSLTAEPPMNRESQASKLAAWDEDLGQIAADVTELSSELAELREYGHALTREVAEREARLGEQAATLVQAEQDRAEWQRRAETATTAVDALNREVVVREDELRTLRARVE